MKGTRNRLHGILALLAFGAVIAITMPAAASVTRAFKDTRHTKAFWHQARPSRRRWATASGPCSSCGRQHVRLVRTQPREPAQGFGRSAA